MQVRESTGARIIFPSKDDQDQELITIIGTKEAVATAKEEILTLIKDLVCPSEHVFVFCCYGSDIVTVIMGVGRVGLAIQLVTMWSGRRVFLGPWGWGGGVLHLL